jgi:hypothetical protein
MQGPNGRRTQKHARMEEDIEKTEIGKGRQRPAQEERRVSR